MKTDRPKLVIRSSLEIMREYREELEREARQGDVPTPGSTGQHDEIVRQCEEAALDMGAAVLRIDAKPMEVPLGVWVSRATRGAPDLIVAVPPGGRLLAVQVKSGNAGLRAAQRRVRDRLQFAGASHAVVRSVAGFRAALARLLLAECGEHGHD